MQCISIFLVHYVFLKIEQLYFSGRMYFSLCDFSIEELKRQVLLVDVAHQSIPIDFSANQ